jgi:hypothetical protein
MRAACSDAGKRGGNHGRDPTASAIADYVVSPGGCPQHLPMRELVCGTTIDACRRMRYRADQPTTRRSGEIERLGEPLVADVASSSELRTEHQPASRSSIRSQMSTTKKPAPRPRATPAARARAEDNERRLDHVMQSLEAAQKDLASIGGSLGTGVRDLRRDTNRLLQDARRDVVKMRRSVQRDLVRLQQDLSAAATAKPAPARRVTATTTRTARRRSAASSQ